MNGYWVSVRNFLWKLVEGFTSERVQNMDNLNSPLSACLKTADTRLNNLDVSTATRCQSGDPRLDNLDAPLSGAGYPVKRILHGGFSFQPNNSGSVDFGTVVNPQKSTVYLNIEDGKVCTPGVYGLSVSVRVSLKDDGSGLDWWSSPYTDSIRINGYVYYWVVEHN